MTVAMMSSLSLSVKGHAHRRPAAINGSVNGQNRVVLGNRRMSVYGPQQNANKAMTTTKMQAVELAQVAGEAGFIGGVAGVMFGITLVGLAFGFILLRVESLAEEGKI